MTATTTTTIRGVSIFSKQRRRKADVFNVALSPEGIVIQRPGRADQQMGWERVSQWELEERPGCVVLTLRGGGSVTPLRVTGWTLDDLETVMREVTAGTTGPPSGADGPPAAGAGPDGVDEPGDTVPVTTAAGLLHGTTAVQPRAQRRKASQRPRRAWKVLVTVALLAVLATAVTLVLLQSGASSAGASSALLPKPSRADPPQARTRTPAKRSSSTTSVGPTRLCARRNSSTGWMSRITSGGRPNQKADVGSTWVAWA